MKHFASFLLLSGIFPLTAVAQEAEPGGVYFTFDLGQSLTVSSDRDLATAEDESGFDSITSLGFGAVTETRSERLSFDLATGVRIRDSEIASDDGEARLAYSRNSADAELELSAGWTRADIAFLRGITDFIDDDGALILPGDFDELTGTGIREFTTASASIRWGDTAPVGYSLSFAQELLRYEDASATLIDADTTSLGAGLRLDLNEVTTANIDLGFTWVDEAGASLEESIAFSGALTFDRPVGDLTTRISATRDDAGTVFWSGSVARSLTLPSGSLAAEFGLSESDTSGAEVIGQIAYSHALPAGLIELGVETTVPAGGDSRTTTLQARYSHDLTPVSRMQVRFDFGEARELDGSSDFATGGISASYGVSLTEFWQFNIGARTDAREDDGVRSSSNTLFVALDRTFSWRP